MLVCGRSYSRGEGGRKRVWKEGKDEKEAIEKDVAVAQGGNGRLTETCRTSFGHVNFQASAQSHNKSQNQTHWKHFFISLVKKSCSWKHEANPSMISD
jgi:hypothetical protein